MHPGNRGKDDVPEGKPRSLQVSGFAQGNRPATLSLGVEVASASFDEAAAELSSKHQVSIGGNDDGINIRLLKQVAKPDFKVKPRLHTECDTEEVETVGWRIKAAGKRRKL